MGHEAFLESCRRANERELKGIWLPSLEEIDALKRQIRTENEARKGNGSHPYLKIYRQPKVGRIDYSQGNITREL
jgi:hypothetical protein